MGNRASTPRNSRSPSSPSLSFSASPKSKGFSKSNSPITTSSTLTFSLPSASSPASICSSATAAAWALRGVNANLPILELLFMNDVMSYLIDYCRLKDLAALASCCLALSYSPWMIRFGDHEAHAVNLEAFLKALERYEDLYELMLMMKSSRFKGQSSSSRHDISLLRLTSGGASPRHQSDSAASSPLAGCVAHTQLSLRHLRLRNFTNVDVAALNQLRHHFPAFDLQIHSLKFAPTYDCETIFASVLPHSLKQLHLPVPSRLSNKQGLPSGLEVLMNLSAVEQIPIFPANLHVLSLTRYAFALPPLPRLRELDLSENNYVASIPLPPFPASLRKLHLFRLFNSPIKGLNDGLEELNLGRDFDQQLEKCTFPRSLLRLTLSRRFNQPLSAAALPESLSELHLGVDFNNALDLGGLKSLRGLTFSAKFNQTISRGQLPEGLLAIYFSKNHSEFDSTIHPGALPSTLILLDLPTAFSQTLMPNVLPNGLLELTIGGKNTFTLSPGVLPSSLQSLCLRGVISFPLTADILPASIRSLTISAYAPQQPPVLPNLLERLSVQASSVSPEKLKEWMKAQLQLQEHRQQLQDVCSEVSMKLSKLRELQVREVSAVDCLLVLQKYRQEISNDFPHIIITS